MKLVLNIGLAVGVTSSIAAHVAREILAANGFLIGSSKIIESDTEPTLVALVYLEDVPSGVIRSLNQTAVDLQQDCIAAWNPTNAKGALIGPNAAKWGAFNPEFFFQLDGTRLAQRTPAAA